MSAAWKWKPLYVEALVEIEIEDGRQKRLEAAKHAIADRLEDSLQGREPLGSAEQVEIEKACSTLLLLRHDPNASETSELEDR
jgi:hypothetical protein